MAGVVAYRLRKLEMANLAGAASIAFALRLPWSALFSRTLFAFGLNVLVYLNNDYADVGIDLRSADKDEQKTRFLAAHLRTAVFVQWALLAGLCAAAIGYDLGLLLPLGAGGGICVWYSAHLKRRPYVDILAMMVWGAAMPLCGVPLSSPLGLGMALQLGLFSGVFETIQVMRDADQDAAVGIRTTGVALGKAGGLVLMRGLMLCSSVYAWLWMHPLAAAASASALLVPFSPERVERYWTRVKLVYGVAWLVLCAAVFVNGHGSGWLAGLAPGAPGR